MNETRVYLCSSIASLRAFGMRCAFPPEINATRTRAETNRSFPRLHSCSKPIDAPLTSCGTVTMSRRSSKTAGFRKSIVIERTTKAEARGVVPRFLEQRLLIGAEQAQVIRSAALHETQKIRVIDNLAGIGIFKVDTHLHVVPSVSNFAVKRDCHSAVPLIARTGTNCLAQRRFFEQALKSCACRKLNRSPEYGRHRAADIEAEAVEVFRTLVNQVTLVLETEELAIALRGDLAAILRFAAGKKNPRLPFGGWDSICNRKHRWLRG